jgi:hypothetical protein
MKFLVILGLGALPGLKKFLILSFDGVETMEHGEGGMREERGERDGFFIN